MADVHVWVVNKSDQRCGLKLDEGSDLLAHLKKLVKQDDLESIKVVPTERQAQKPLEKRTNDELKQYAADNGIDLGEATKKEDILAAITAAEAPPQN